MRDDDWKGLVRQAETSAAQVCTQLQTICETLDAAEAAAPSEDDWPMPDELAPADAVAEARAGLTDVMDELGEVLKQIEEVGREVVAEGGEEMLEIQTDEPVSDASEDEDDDLAWDPPA